MSVQLDSRRQSRVLTATWLWYVSDEVRAGPDRDKSQYLSASGAADRFVRTSVPAAQAADHSIQSLTCTKLLHELLLSLHEPLLQARQRPVLPHARMIGLNMNS